MSDTPAPATPTAERAPARRISTATLIIGVSGAGKTSLLETFAMYLWETYGQILLLYSWDGGAIPTGIQKRIRQGIIRFWRARTRSAPGLALETLALATKGYWPQRIDPATGETAPSIDLVAPIQSTYALSCDKGHLIKTVPLASLIVPSQCPTCNVMIPVVALQVTEATKRTKGFDLVGGVAYDGISSMAQVVMDDMDRMRGIAQIGGEKSSFGGAIHSGSVNYGGNNRADVGFAQSRAQQWVANSLSIPNLKESPVFTGLSTEGSDKGGLTIIGVDLPGQAALTQAPQWFGNIVEADAMQDENGKKHFVLRTTPFTDKEGRRHLLKTSASPNGIPTELIDPPLGEGEPFTNFNLGKVFKLLDADLKRALGDELPGAPGMPDGVMEYGEPLRVDTAGGSRPVPAAIAPAPGRASVPVVPSVAGAGASAPPTGQGGKAIPSMGPKPPQVAQPAQTAHASSAAPSTTAAAPPPPGRPPARVPGK